MSAVAAHSHAAVGVHPGGYGVSGRYRAVVALRQPLPNSRLISPQRALRRSDAYSAGARGAGGSKPGVVTVNAASRDTEVADSNPGRGGQEPPAEFVVLNPDQVQQPAAAESSSSSGTSSSSSSGPSSPKGQRPKRSPEEFADLVPPSERRGPAAASLSSATSCRQSCALPSEHPSNLKLGAGGNASEA